MATCERKKSEEELLVCLKCVNVAACGRIQPELCFGSVKSHYSAVCWWRLYRIMSTEWDYNPSVLLCPKPLWVCLLLIRFFPPALPVFFCLLLGSFLTELPWLRRRTGLVSHFLRVFPERLGPGELDCSELRDGCGWRLATDSVFPSEPLTG